MSFYIPEAKRAAADDSLARQDQKEHEGSTISTSTASSSRNCRGRLKFTLTWKWRSNNQLSAWL